MRKKVLHGGGLLMLALLGGCHLLIGYRDAVIDEGEGGAGSTGGAGGGCQVNGIEDGEETARDCGGPACPPCDDGKACEVGTDCASEVCTAGICRPAACDDGVQNGAESDMDCGGSAASGCAGCADGAACKAHVDCLSEVCKAGVCTRSLLWARQFGPVEETKIAAGPDGVSFVVGLSQGNVNLGGGMLTVNGLDILIAGYDAEGNHQWSGAFGDMDVQFAADAAVDHSGALVATGYFEGTLDLGPPALVNNGSNDVFVAKLAPDGAHAWSRGYGDTLNQLASLMTIGPQNEIVVAGIYMGSINFGGGDLPSLGSMQFLVKLSANGGHAWSRAYQGVTIDHLATDSDGNVFAAGRLETSADLGGGPLPFSGNNDGFVLKLSPSGSHLWSKGLPIYIAGIAVDAAGNLLLTGGFNGVLGFTDPPMTSTGYPGSDNTDPYLIKLGPDGEPGWSRQYGGAGSAGCGSPALDPLGNIVVLYATGEGPATDFGGRELLGRHIIKLDAAGNYLWSRPLGDLNGGVPFIDFAAPDAEHVVLVGQLKNTFDLGAGPMTSQSYGDLVLARFLVPSGP